MSSLWRLIAILVFVTIHNIQRSDCGDEFGRLDGYNLLDDVLGKYSSKADDDSQLLEPGNQLFDQVPDEMAFKVSASIAVINFLSMKSTEKLLLIPLDHFLNSLADRKSSEQGLQPVHELRGRHQTDQQEHGA